VGGGGGGGGKETFVYSFSSQYSVIYSCLVSVQCSKPLSSSVH